MEEEAVYFNPIESLPLWQVARIKFAVGFQWKKALMPIEVCGLIVLRIHGERVGCGCRFQSTARGIGQQRTPQAALLKSLLNSQPTDANRGQRRIAG